jgi:glycopeptide antibiotics resistance protein
MLGNIAIFLPIGFFIALLWRKPRWWKSLFAGFATSFVIEFVQFFIGRSTDIDDIILNSAGALVGFWLFWLLRAVAPNVTAKFHCQVM